MVNLTTAADPTAASTGTPAPGETTITPSSYATSKIIRTAIAASIIILALSALVMSFKISAWIRYRQRLRREYHLTTILQSEQRANAYEIAAWADEPGAAPVSGNGSSGAMGWREKRREKKRQQNAVRAQKRGGANAFAVKEWEGVAS